jgi:hydrogenase-4 component F
MTLLLLIAAPILAAALGHFLPNRWRDRGQLLGATLTTALGLGLSATVFTSGPIGDGLLYLDPLGALLVVVISLVGWGGAAYSIGYLRHDVAVGHLPASQPRWFYVWYHLFLASMLAVVTTDNLGLVWVAVEATTVFSAILVGFYRTRDALEAAWKYLIICTVGISFALLGTLLLYYAGVHAIGGEAAALSWRVLREHAATLDPRLVRLAFALILVGYGTKAGFAPLHTWLPDAHSQAPTPVSAVLSGVLLPCALYAIVRVHLVAVGALGPEFSSAFLIGMGVISAAVAVPFILIQHDLKRLLAYSSMEHIGIMAVAFGFGGPIGFFAAAVHLVTHGLGKALLFFAAGALAERYGTRNMARIHGAVQALPYSGPILLLGALALAGAPPTGLFLSEFSVLAVGFSSGRILASVALLACVTLIFVGMLFHAGRMVLGTPRAPVKRGEALGTLALTGAPLAVVTLAGIYIPPPIAGAIGQVVALLGGT